MLWREVQRSNSISCDSNPSTFVRADRVIWVPHCSRGLPAGVEVWFCKVRRSVNPLCSETTETWWHRWLLEHCDAQPEELGADVWVLHELTFTRARAHAHPRQTPRLCTSKPEFFPFRPRARLHNFPKSVVTRCTPFEHTFNPLWRVYSLAVTSSRHLPCQTSVSINTQYETEASVWQL